MNVFFASSLSLLVYHLGRTVDEDDDDEDEDDRTAHS